MPWSVKKAMSQHRNKLIRFLASIGVEKLPHVSGPYSEHLTRVYDELKGWGCGTEVASAGFFHSIYGTERFTEYGLPLERRTEVRALIGSRAEMLAFTNCAMMREDFDHAVERDIAPYVFGNRFTGGVISMAARDFKNLCAIHLCDWLDQVQENGEWNYRRATYERVAARLGGAAMKSFERLYQARTQSAPP